MIGNPLALNHRRDELQRLLNGRIALLLPVLVLLATAGFAQLRDPTEQYATPETTEPREATSTLPSATDPRIRDFDDPHLSFLPRGTPRGQLFLFLPGTGSKPGSKNIPLCEVAASLGYHAISLMYPDRWASQKKVSRSSDPEAYLKFRLAIIEGGAIGPRVTISRADSIENRLERLLVHLDTIQPHQGWEQFFDGHGGIRWNRFVPAGASQGGGHAYILGKYHEVARVIMLSAPKDFSFYFRGPARGFDSRTRTPLDRFFAFNHVRDNGNGCDHDQQTAILRQIGLLDLGVASIDATGPDFAHAHVLYTDMDVPSEHYHGSTMQPDPRCIAAWKYMLTEPVR